MSIRVLFAISTVRKPVRGASEQAVQEHPTCQEFTISSSPIPVKELIDAMNARQSIPRGSALLYLDNQRWLDFPKDQFSGTRELIIKVATPWIQFKVLYEVNAEGRLFMRANLENTQSRISHEVTVLFDSQFCGGLLLADNVAQHLRLQPKNSSVIFAHSNGVHYFAESYGYLLTSVLLDEEHFRRMDVPESEHVCSKGVTGGPAPCDALEVLAMDKRQLEALLSRGQPSKQDQMLHPKVGASARAYDRGYSDLKVIPVKRDFRPDAERGYEVVVGCAAMCCLGLGMDYDARRFIERESMLPMSWNMWLMSF